MSERQRDQMSTAFYYFVGIVSWPVLRLLYRLRWRGRENVPPGGIVLASNHHSNFDPWPLGYPLWPKRRLRWMGKSELFNPILGPILRRGGAFPVRRGTNDREAIERAIDLAHAGDIVVMFPEGTRRKKGLRKKYDRTRTPVPRALRSSRASRSSRPPSGEPTGSRGSVHCASRTVSPCRSTTSSTMITGRRRRSPRSG